MRPSTLVRGLAAAALSLAFVVAPARVAANESWWTETLGTPSPAALWQRTPACSSVTPSTKG